MSTQLWVVAGHQVGVLLVQPLQALHVPANGLYQVHPQAADGNPGFRDPVHDKRQLALDERDGDEQLEQGQGRTAASTRTGCWLPGSGGYQAAQGREEIAAW